MKPTAKHLPLPSALLFAACVATSLVLFARGGRSPAPAIVPPSDVRGAARDRAEVLLGRPTPAPTPDDARVDVGPPREAPSWPGVEPLPPALLEGEVLDERGLAVPGALVMLGGQGTLADVRGCFRLEGRHFADDRRLRISRRGYVPFEREDAQALFQPFLRVVLADAPPADDRVRSLDGAIVVRLD